VTSNSQPANFELVTRTGCHLCEVMEAVLLEELPRYGLKLNYRDVDADPALEERFGDVVPVLLRDGVPVAKVRIEPEQVRRLITRSC